MRSRFGACRAKISIWGVLRIRATREYAISAESARLVRRMSSSSNRTVTGPRTEWRAARSAVRRAAQLSIPPIGTRSTSLMMVGNRKAAINIATRNNAGRNQGELGPAPSKSGPVIGHTIAPATIHTIQRGHQALRNRRRRSCPRARCASSRSERSSSNLPSTR